MKAENPPSRAERWLGPGELALQANTSIKALRVYESAGLLAPERRPGGWRIYGPAQVARLHQILALKALGLSLKQIGKALGPEGLAIGRVLDLQAAHLAQELRTARHRLRQIQSARRHLAEHGVVPSEVLLDLSRDLTPEPPPDLPELRSMIEDLARRDGVEAQIRATLRLREDEAAALEARISEMVTEAALLAVDGDPGSPAAASLADRWLALAAGLDLPAADADGAAALRGLSAQIGADPRLAETFAFLRNAVRLRTHSRPTRG